MIVYSAAVMTFLSRIKQSAFFVRFNDERGHTEGFAVFTQRHKDKVSCQGFPFYALEDVLCVYRHLNFHGGLADIGELGLNRYEIADPDGLHKVDPFNPQGNHLGPAVF